MNYSLTLFYAAAIKQKQESQMQLQPRLPEKAAAVFSSQEPLFGRNEISALSSAIEFETSRRTK